MQDSAGTASLSDWLVAGFLRFMAFQIRNARTAKTAVVEIQPGTKARDCWMTAAAWPRAGRVWLAPVPVVPGEQRRHQRIPEPAIAEPADGTEKIAHMRARTRAAEACADGAVDFKQAA